MDPLEDYGARISHTQFYDRTDPWPDFLQDFPAHLVPPSDLGMLGHGANEWAHGGNLIEHMEVATWQDPEPYRTAAEAHNVTPSLGNTPQVVGPTRDDSVIICYVCGEHSSSYEQLRCHALFTGHATLECSVQTCQSLCVQKNQTYRDHLKSEHPDSHSCEECMYVGNNAYEMACHAHDTGHAAFVCKHEDCDKKFSRLDTYQRHQRTHREDAKRFPCKYCKKYRGSNGFKRKDHLTQHVRNYHHIGEDELQSSMYNRMWCPKKSEACPASFEFHPRSVPFKSSAQWVKHMRTVHDESDFPCPQPGCDRVNGKGYFRKADLRAHLRKVHGTDGSLDSDQH